MTLIKTYDGTVKERSECRKIGGKYYEKNTQCFYLQDSSGIFRWYRKVSDKITYDYETLSYVVLENSILTRGVVDINPDGSYVYGYFTRNLLKNCIYVNYNKGDHIYFINEELAKKANLAEIEGNNVFMNKTDIDKYKDKFKNKPSEGTYTLKRYYNSSHQIPEILALTRRWYRNNPELSKPLIPYGKLLDNYSWGIEFETSRGNIPERYLMREGLIRLRDGSITGDEFTTVPFTGLDGVNRTIRCAQLLNKHCTIDSNCSTHIHIGGFLVNEETVWAIYVTALALESELYSLFHAGVKNTSLYKRQDYCNPLHRVSVNLNNTVSEKIHALYTYLSQGHTFQGFGLEHPNNPNPGERESKWHVNTRYTGISLIPVMFGNRGTVEFRMHIATLNYQKVLNWLFITKAIIHYAVSNSSSLSEYTPRKLPQISLQDILYYNYKENPEFFAYLVSYIEKRKELVARMNSIGDISGSTELAEDSTFTFNTDTVNYNLPLNELSV